MAYGFFTPATTEAPPSGAAGCRYINPATRDYEVDSDTGQLAQMPAKRQRVLIAVMTELGSSSALQDLGIRRPRKMGTNFEGEMRAAVRATLRTMVDVEKVIRIDDIIVKRGSGGRAETTIVFTDLETEEQHEVSV